MYRLILILLICGSIKGQMISADSIAVEIDHFMTYVKQNYPEGYHYFEAEPKDAVFVILEDELFASNIGFRIIPVPQNLIFMIEENLQQDSFCFSLVINETVYLIFKRLEDDTISLPCTGESLEQILASLPYYHTEEYYRSRGEVLHAIFDPVILGGAFSSDTLLVFPSWSGPPLTKNRD